MSSMPLLSAAPANMLVHSSSTCARSMGSFSSATLPARIFDRSSRSLTICSRICADERIVFVRCDCVADSAVRVRSSVMPTTPFIGVRSSWLMRSRKSLFARAASSSWRLLSDELASAQLHFGLEALARRDHLAKLLAVALNSVRRRTRAARARRARTPGRRPWRGIAVDRQARAARSTRESAFAARTSST